MTLYYVTQDGYKITDKLSLQAIIERFGNIEQLEAAGFRLVAA